MRRQGIQKRLFPERGMVACLAANCYGKLLLACCERGWNREFGIVPGRLRWGGKFPEMPGLGYGGAVHENFGFLQIGLSPVGPAAEDDAVVVLADRRFETDLVGKCPPSSFIVPGLRFPQYTS